MKRLVAIDFETANSKPESACSVGVSVFEDGIEIDSFYTLIKPLEEYGRFDYWNIKIHHIRPQDVEDAPGFDKFYDWLSKYFKDSVFVAHNAEFDMNVLKRCAVCWNLPIPDIQYFCSVRLSKKMLPFLDHHRLNDVCSYMNIELDHHNAASDAEACAMIVLNCMILANETNLEKFIKNCQIPLKSL